MTAVTRCPIGPIFSDPELFAMLKTAARETMAVARAKGVPIPDKVIDDVERSYGALPPHMISSATRRSRRSRAAGGFPWLSGAVVRIGNEVGVDTPTHKFIATVLKPHVNGRE